jgi:hypothetical protein
MDEPMEAMSAANLELERRLESYARVRLSPDPLAVARIRARVMREVRLEFDLGRSIAAAAGAPPPRSFFRPITKPILAAGLWLAIGVGTIAAAQPGGPLYPTRMWIERAALPTTADARTTAEILQLETRLAEVMAASAEGDGPAALAALAAYRQIADAALLDAGTSDERLAQVRAALDRHLAVLGAVADQLMSKGNDQAAAAIQAKLERAIEHNNAVIDKLTKPTGNSAPGTPSGNSQPKPTQVAQPSLGGPPASADPASPKPVKTPPGQGRP